MMANIEASECNTVSKPVVGYCNGGAGHVGTINVQESEDVGGDILHEMDSFLEDLDDRLTISRMVSDSVIKGMVTAISQEAAEVIASKEREVAGLSKVLCSRQSVSGGINVSEIEICGEVEGAIFGTIVRCLREEHERRLWDVDNVLAFIDRCKEISSLRRELDSIQRSLVSHDVGHFSPKSSGADISHRKLPSNHVHSGGLDGNGDCGEFKLSMPENFEMSKLTHMSKAELYQYFRTEITKMKRDHESVVQQKTEEYFSLKREFMKEREPLKERGPTVRKDNDFELLRKKMSEVISRLDNILKENEKLSEFCNHSRDTLNSLHSENCRLWNLLNNKKLESCYLSFQVSDVTEKLSQHSIVEENLQKLVGDLTSSLEDARLEASMSEEVYKCILTELVANVKSDNEDLDLKSEEAFHAANMADVLNYGELDLMSSLVQQVYSTVYQEVVTDMSMELNDMKNKRLKEGESLVHLEAKVSKIEKELTMEIKEKENMRQQALMLEKLIEDKDKCLFEVTEKLHTLMDLRKQQESLLADRDQELVLLLEELKESQNRVDFYTTEVGKLNEALVVSESKVRKSEEEKIRLVSGLEQQQNDLALFRAKYKAHQKQMESICCAFDGLSKSMNDLELRTNRSIEWHSSRLENSAFQISSLVQKVNMLRRTSSLYKSTLENRDSDLRKAEAEVDILGDEVDNFVGLLEKIYVALDHYSPILQHYPGVIEILKLVRRKLGGEAVKGV